LTFVVAAVPPRDRFARLPGGALWQIFVRDSNGVMLELNYEAAKEKA